MMRRTLLDDEEEEVPSRLSALRSSSSARSARLRPLQPQLHTQDSYCQEVSVTTRAALLHRHIREGQVQDGWLVAPR